MDRQEHAGGGDTHGREATPRRPRPGLLRFWLGALALCLALGTGAWSAWRAAQTVAQEAALLEPGQRAQAALGRLLAGMRDAESGQRGYLVTGDARFLATHEAAVRALRHELIALEPLLRDRPEQAARYTDLRALVPPWLARLDSGIVARQDAWRWFALGDEELQVRMRADKVAVDRLLALVAALQAGEVRAAQEQQAKLDRAAGEARLAIVLPALASLLLVIAVFSFIGRGEAARRRADAAWRGERERLLAEERVARLEAEEASRAKDEFLATASHELRTPLQGVMGWVEVLKRSQSSEEQRRQALERIEHNARSQVRIVEDVLDAARMLSGKLKLRLAPVELEEVIRDAADICRPAAQAKEIDFGVHVAEPGLRLVCDRDRLQQIAVNLLSNAVKFTPRGGRVALALSREASQIEIEVRDSGIGIAPELLERIFDRYVQASVSSSRRYGGLGLGLSIVRHLAELHGGTVTAASEGEGRGATFVVRLPIGAAAAPPAASVAGGEAAGPVAGPIAGLRVLVVDDEADTRELLTVLLSAEGALVETAESARGAFARLGDTRFDAIVSDIGMPDEDGYALLRRVRATLRNSAGTPPAVPAIALTAFAGFRDRRRALEAGFDAQLAKPVEIAQLVAALAWVTGRSALGRGL